MFDLFIAVRVANRNLSQNTTAQQPCLNLLQTSIPLHLHLLQNLVRNMVMASLGVSQAIFFSNTTTTSSRFNLHPNKPPTFSFQNNPSISIFSRRNRTPHFLRCTPNSTNDTSSLNWDWNRWCRHFDDIEQAESFASLLKVP